MMRRDRRTPDLAAYAGKWVALSKNRVVAVDSSLPKLMRKVSPPTPKPPSAECLSRAPS